MQRLLTNVPLFTVALALAACAGSGPAAPSVSSTPDTTRSASAQPPKTKQPAEDLSKYRPTFTPPPAPKLAAPKIFVAPTNSVNAFIEQRLRDQAYTNQNVKYTNGWRIQAYVGLEREQAMAIRRSVISRFPGEADYIIFKQPLYRLYIGDYNTRLEAERALLRIQPLAPKAELQAMQVLINKTRF